MNCAEKIVYIIDKMMHIGIGDNDQFVGFIADLVNMSSEELDIQIQSLEDIE
jgi:hypothetical protein